MPYVKPQEVRSPRESWNLIQVLREGIAGEHALAVGDWEGERCLALRWNGTDERPAGNPQSRGNGTWFIVPQEYNAAIISTLSGTAAILGKALMPTAQSNRSELRVGSAKHRMMQERDAVRAAQDFLLHAEILKQCDRHEEISAAYGPMDDESLAELIGDLPDDISFDAVRRAFDEAPARCFICEKNAGDD